MSLYKQDHPYSNGLEICTAIPATPPTLFALVAERLQQIELKLEAAEKEIAELKAAPAGVTKCDDSSSSQAL
jgi:hypothetical protein